MATNTSPSANDRTLEEPHTQSNLPDATPDISAQALEGLVNHSSEHSDVSHGLHASSHNIASLPWLHKLIPGIEGLAAKHHVGNFVAIRGTNKTFFEAMPIYARVGMHLLFCGNVQKKVLHYRSIEHLLQEQSVKEGKIYDSPESVRSIPSFIKTYDINTDELLNQDLKSYKNFNEFFSRKLKPGARPVDNAEDPAGVCSAADCRLTVYQTITLAKQFWIKGKQFTIPNLLNISPEDAKPYEDASLAIFRLAPSDYHRFHSPIDGVVGDITHIPGQYYTVNPQAVNEVSFDVFTANTRSVLYMKHESSGVPVVFVAIGAMLVGSIGWTNGAQKGTTVKRGEELGFFAYGGSTIVAVFPKGFIQFDEDLVKNSEKPMETLVKVGSSIGGANVAH